MLRREFLSSILVAPILGRFALSEVAAAPISILGPPEGGWIDMQGCSDVSVVDSREVGGFTLRKVAFHHRPDGTVEYRDIPWDSEIEPLDCPDLVTYSPDGSITLYDV